MMLVLVNLTSLLEYLATGGLVVEKGKKMGKKIGIVSRLDEAKLLYLNGFKEGALISLLVAVAATARDRYPRDRYSDNKSFKGFLKDGMCNGDFWGPNIYLLAKMDFQGKVQPLENILYDIIRCDLLHESKLSDLVRYEKKPSDNFVLRIGEEGNFIFQDSLLECLFRVVHNAQENLELFNGKFLRPRRESSVKIGKLGNPLIISAQILRVPLA